MYYDYNSMTQEKLRELALTSGNVFVRYCAVDKLTDQETLKCIALKKYEAVEVRIKAVKRLTDQEALKYLALNDEEWKIREIAVDKLTDQETLEYIVLNDEHWEVKATAKSSLISIISRKSDN